MSNTPCEVLPPNAAEHSTRFRRRQHTTALARVLAGRLCTNARAETFGEVLDAYVTELRRTASPSLIDVESTIECWLRPAFAELAPQEVTALCVAGLVEVMEAAALAPNTIRNKCGFTRTALAFAVRKGLLDRNPIESLRGVLPKKRNRPGFSPRREVLSVAGFCGLVTDDRLPWRDRVAYALQGGCGLRAAESYELRVRDIDREAPFLAALHVMRQWSRKRKRIDPPKSGEGRVVPLHPEVLAFVDAWIAEGLPRLLGRAVQPDDLLLWNPRLPHGHMNDRTALRRLKGHLKARGLEPRRQHGFRHTFFAHLLDAGVPVDVVGQFTHPKPCKDARDAYANYSWRALCEARMRVELRLTGGVDPEPTEPSSQLELFAVEAYESHAPIVPPMVFVEAVA